MISTGLNFLMAIVIGIIVPKVLGAQAYGEFNYIIATYSFLFQLFLFASSTGYIYFLSNGKHKVEDVNTFYFLFLSVVTLLVVLISFITINTSIGLQYLWIDLKDKSLLYIGLIYGVLVVIQQRLIEYSDSTSQTIISEKLKIGTRFLIVLTILSFVFMDILSIYWFFILSILNFIIFIGLFLKFVIFKFKKIDKEKLLDIFNDFYIYLRPLVVFTLIAAVYSYLGKYVLQSSGGSIEQGYYNFALKLAMIPVTFISSIMAIYMSEMTKKFQANDLEGVKEIFVNNLFKIYSIHAFIAFFMLVNAKEIILLTVGEQFLGAIGALQALSIFSLLHTFGMLSGNLFFSSGRNKQYSIINSITMVPGIVYLSYMLKENNLNATHLAVVMASFYGARVMIQLYVNINHLSISKLKFISELILVTLIVLGTFELVNTFGLNLFLNLLVATLILLIINFIFRDYINIKIIQRKIHGIS